MSEKPIIRWGIIGAGDIAERVTAPAMAAAAHSELVAVMRRNRTAAEEFAGRHGASRAYDRVEGLLGDPQIDAVYVATPVERHCPDVLAAAASGKHILCEKPLALSILEGERMREACKQADLLFMTCYYQRFNARHRRIKEILATGEIGQVTSVRMNFSGRSPQRPGAWRQDPAQSGGGVYIDNGSHCIDLLRFFFGEITAVAAFVATLVESYSVEDTVSSVLRLSNGAQAVVTCHWSTGDPDEHRNAIMEILGTDGAILSSPQHEKFSRGRLVVATASGERTYSFEESTHVNLLEEFAAAVAEGRPPAVGIEDGIAAQRVVEAVYESSRSGRVVSLQ